MIQFTRNEKDQEGNMVSLPANRLYFFACCSVAGTLSLGDYLSEEIASKESTEIREQYSSWFGYRDNLAGWLIEECGFASKSEERNEAGRIFRAGDRLVDILFERDFNQLVKASQEAHSAFPNISVDEWAYY